MSTETHLPVSRGLGGRFAVTIWDGWSLRLGRHSEVHLAVVPQPKLGELLGQRPQEVAQERGLAGADLAGDHRDRRVRQHAVLEHRVGAGVALGPVEEVRVGQERERPLGQTEVVVVDSERTRHTHPAPTRPPEGGHQAFRTR